MIDINDQLSIEIAKVKVRDHRREDEVLKKVGKVIDDWYINLVRVSGNRVTIYREVPRIHAFYMRRLVDTYLNEIDNLMDRAYDETSDAIISILPDDAVLYLLREHGETSELQESLSSLLTKTGKLLKEVVFAPMKRSVKQAILVTSQVVERISRTIRGITASVLLSVITQGQSKGLDQKEIGKKLLEPIAQIVKSNVQRATRTATSIATNKANMESYQKLGKMLIGFQLHTHPPDPGSRWWHLKRRFNKYYFKPKEGQLGMGAMPNPPFEPLDPSLRPAKEPFCAYNCRCWLKPIVRIGAVTDFGPFKSQL